MAKRSIGAAEFKQHCLSLLDDVGADGIVITKHGRPVAKLIPIEQDAASTIGCLRGKLKIHGDLASTGVRWNAES